MPQECYKNQVWKPWESTCHIPVAWQMAISYSMDSVTNCYIFKRCVYFQKQIHSFQWAGIEKKGYAYFVIFLTHIDFIRWRVGFYYGISRVTVFYFKKYKLLNASLISCYLLETPFDYFKFPSLVHSMLWNLTASRPQHSSASLPFIWYLHTAFYIEHR